MGSVGLTTSKPPMALASIWRRLRSGPARKIPATKATPIAITLLTIRSRNSSMCSRSVISSNTSGSLGSGSRGRDGSLAGSLIGIFFSFGGFSARAMSGSLQSVCGCRPQSTGIRNGLSRRPRSAEICGYPRLTADRTLPAVLVDVLHRIRDGTDVFGILILDLEVELLLHRHDHFDQIERIGVEIADELGVHRYFVFVDAEPVGDDHTNALKRRSHPRSSPPYAARHGRVGSTETLPQVLHLQQVTRYRRRQQKPRSGAPSAVRT